MPSTNLMFTFSPRKNYDREMQTEGCSYFRSNILFNRYSRGVFFVARRPQQCGTERREPHGAASSSIAGHGSERDTLPWLALGRAGNAGRATLAGEVRSHLRHTAGFPWRRRGSASPLSEMAAGSRHFPPLRAARPARPGPALPTPLGGGAASAALFLLPRQRPAPASPSSASAVRAASLPPSLGRSLLRRQRRCPPAPWRRSPSPRR